MEQHSEIRITCNCKFSKWNKLSAAFNLGFNQLKACLLRISPIAYIYKVLNKKLFRILVWYQVSQFMCKRTSLSPIFWVNFFSDPPKSDVQENQNFNKSYVGPTSSSSIVRLGRFSQNQNCTLVTCPGPEETPWGLGVVVTPVRFGTKGSSSCWSSERRGQYRQNLLYQKQPESSANG